MIAEPELKVSGFTLTIREGAKKMIIIIEDSVGG